MNKNFEKYLIRKLGKYEYFVNYEKYNLEQKMKYVNEWKKIHNHNAIIIIGTIGLLFLFSLFYILNYSHVINLM
jgi:hypothetical protein